MEVTRTLRGFEIILHDTHENVPKQERLVQASSVVGDYDDAFDRPGTSALWIGDDKQHLWREEVAELIQHMQAWLDTGSLEIAATEVMGGERGRETSRMSEILHMPGLEDGSVHCNCLMCQQTRFKSHIVDALTTPGDITFVEVPPPEPPQQQNAGESGDGGQSLADFGSCLCGTRTRPSNLIHRGGNDYQCPDCLGWFLPVIGIGQSLAAQLKEKAREWATERNSTEGIARYIASGKAHGLSDAAHIVEPVEKAWLAERQAFHNLLAVIFRDELRAGDFSTLTDAANESAQVVRDIRAGWERADERCLESEQAYAALVESLRGLQRDYERKGRNPLHDKDRTFAAELAALLPPVAPTSMQDAQAGDAAGGDQEQVS